MAINDNIMSWKNIRGEVNCLKKKADTALERATTALEIAEQLMGFEVSSITEIDDDILDKARVGDLIIKITKVGDDILKHQYRVSYKQEKHGICLSYFDAGRLETVSYDYDGERKHWVYNSTDVFSVEDYATKSFVNDAIRTATEGMATESYVNGAINTAILGAINAEY